MQRQKSDELQQLLEDSEMENNHFEQNTIKEHKPRFLHSFGCIVFSILIICIIIFLITNLM